MEYNQPSEIVKDLNFGDSAKNRISTGVDKLAKAVKSTLGASGKCVIYEDARGNPVITKDGVTVAESVVLFDPVENIGATLIKEASRNTVREAGDGTTTAIVLAESLLREVNKMGTDFSIREIKSGINSSLEKINNYLSKKSIEVKDKMLNNVASISCNNDEELGNTIAEAYGAVGKNGVVLMEESEDNTTYVETVEGVQIDCGLKSPYFVTDKERETSTLENPLVLIVSSEIPNIRKIQSILEFVIKNKRSLLIVAPVSQQVQTALMMNKVKGNIDVNIIDTPGFGPYANDTVDDLAFLTGATVVNEELGDDLDLIRPDHLGEALRSVTDAKNTVLKVKPMEASFEDRVIEVEKKISKEKDAFLKRKLQDRLSILSGSVGIVRVGADSKVELKEKKDRVEDAIYAVKAALKEGIISGGGISLLNASQKIKPKNECESILLRAIVAPYHTILQNASIEDSVEPLKEDWGFDVVSGKHVNMIKHGIIDPVLVTKTALKNAVSVVSTIISADCVISNMRTNESN
jgi:chaperonin GroEL